MELQLMHGKRVLALAVTACLFAAPAVHAMDYEDHYEFEASLSAPYMASADHYRSFQLDFRFPGADDGTLIAWRLDVMGDNGFVVRTFRGESQLTDGSAQETVRWSERDAQNGPLPNGFYKARMRAYAINPAIDHGLAFGGLQERVDRALAIDPAALREQTFDVQVGAMPKPAMPAFARLATNAPASMTTQSKPATGGVPYTVFLGNLHSQTNHSDGGGDVSTCTDAQNPQC